MDTFVLTAALLRLIFALAAVYAVVRVSAWLDDRAGKPFADTIDIIISTPMGTAVYYAARFVALALLIGMVVGCTQASAGVVMTDRYDRDIHRAVETYWPDYPRFASAKAQLYVESRLDPAAVSPVGARGIAQFMPATWADVTRQLRLGDVSPVHDVAIQAYGYYMAQLRQTWRRGRDPADRQPLAQASYNAGAGNIIRAQTACGGARLWAAIAPCLGQVTGAHARETLTYVDRIDRYTLMIEAGL